jgi:hypothetical protein
MVCTICFIHANVSKLFANKIQVREIIEFGQTGYYPLINKSFVQVVSSRNDTWNHLLLFSCPKIPILSQNGVFFIVRNSRQSRMVTSCERSKKRFFVTNVGSAKTR